MCIIILDNALLKVTTVKWLLTKLPEIFVFVTSFTQVFWSLEEAPRFPVIKSHSTKSSYNGYKLGVCMKILMIMVSE
jgi:hypothetical protein